MFRGVLQNKKILGRYDTSKCGICCARSEYSRESKNGWLGALDIKNNFSQLNKKEKL